MMERARPGFKILLCLLLVLAGSRRTLSARTTISGTVRSAKTHRTLGSVNVMLQSPSRQAMCGYAITGDDGTYSLDYTGTADSLLVVVTGFNIHGQTRLVAAWTQRVDFFLGGGVGA